MVSCRDHAARGTEPHQRAVGRASASGSPTCSRGDGDLHPLVLFDDTVPGEQKAAEELSA